MSATRKALRSMFSSVVLFAGCLLAAVFVLLAIHYFPRTCAAIAGAVALVFWFAHEYVKASKT